jgi:hypothetical protein
VPIAISEWIEIITVSVTIVFAVEIDKLIRRRKIKNISLKDLREE